VKRLFDITISVSLLILLIPVLIVTAILIMASLGRPILFKQKRPGLFGKPFILYKFRTMKELRGDDGELLPDLERTTVVGRYIRKFSIDEFPQLYNVIKGDMSIVGPRPLLMEYLELYSKEQSRRHNIKPGITGWAQVNGRNETTWNERLKLDVNYVDNYSALLDIKILFMTILNVLKGSGVNNSGENTMPKFKGNKSSNE
jgi:sugar transferase EpsL